MFTIRYDVNIRVFVLRNCFSGFETYCRVFLGGGGDCAFMRGVGPSDSALSSFAVLTSVFNLTAIMTRDHIILDAFGKLVFFSESVVI
jgi:hypothetical protein